MKHVKLLATFLVLGLALTLSACAGAVGEKNTAVNCTGYCPNLTVNATPNTDGEPEYGPVSSARVGSGVPSQKKTAANSALMKRSSLNWKKYGGDPWILQSGKTAAEREGLDDAMKHLKQELKLPDNVVTKLLMLAESDKGIDGKLKKGDKLNAMMYGRGGKSRRHKIAMNVNVLFKQPASTREYFTVHEGSTYVLVKPERCANWSIRVKGKATPAVPAQTKPPVKPADS